MRKNLSGGSRGVRLGELPILTVVVTSRSDRPRLDACLQSLLSQTRTVEASIVVVRQAGPEEIQELSGAYPEAKFVGASEDTTIPQMRALGLAEADGDIVMLRDDEPVPDGWLNQIALRRQSTQQ